MADKENTNRDAKRTEIWNGSKRRFSPILEGHFSRSVSKASSTASGRSG